MIIDDDVQGWLHVLGTLDNFEFICTLVHFDVI